MHSLIKWTHCIQSSYHLRHISFKHLSHCVCLSVSYSLNHCMLSHFASFMVEYWRPCTHFKSNANYQNILLKWINHVMNMNWVWLLQNEWVRHRDRERIKRKKEKKWSLRQRTKCRRFGIRAYGCTRVIYQTINDGPFFFLQPDSTS